MDSDLEALKSHKSPWLVMGWNRRAMGPAAGIRQESAKLYDKSSVDDISPS